MPAGNQDGGQWTSGGNGSGESVTSEGGGRAVYIAVGAASSDTDNPEFQRVASTVTIDYSRALTGVSTIDETTKALSETLARVMNTMDFIPEQTPQAYGTAVHVAFGTLVRFQGLPGIGPNDVEHSFVGGESGRRYGEPDSVRTDVVLRNDAGDVIAIYDVKTGERGLTAARVRELREKTGVGPNIPIIELHVRRGASLKGHLRRQRSIGFIMAQLWDPTHHRDNAGLSTGP